MSSTIPVGATVRLTENVEVTTGTLPEGAEGVVQRNLGPAQNELDAMLGSMFGADPSEDRLMVTFENHDSGEPALPDYDVAAGWEGMFSHQVEVIAEPIDAGAVSQAA